MKRASPVPDTPPLSGEPDDAEVIAASVEDPERFAILFRRHGQDIARYVARRLGAEIADDIVADTFLVAFDRRASYDVRRPDARPWLYGIAGNHIRRHRRDEVRKLRALQRTGVDEVVESFADRVDARITAGVESRSLALAIAKLSPEQREVLLLVCWAELSYDQVAEAIGIPAGTVRSRMNRARTKLRVALVPKKGSANG
jgi:RNA polymerase sigma factor (sigma-70 family)